MENYMIDLKGFCYHEGKQHAKEWKWKFYKFKIFENLNNAFDFINEFISAFRSAYESILPNRVKRFNYFYTYSIYKIEEYGITEINHDTIITEVVRKCIK